MELSTRMDYPQNLSETDRHWFDLILECRTSGKSDRQWLAENNIKSPTFYYHVKQLRKKSGEIPENAIVESAAVQDVVPLIIEDMSPAVNDSTGLAASSLQRSAETDTAIRLSVKGITVEITNHASQNLIQNTLSALQFLC